MIKCIAIDMDGTLLSNNHAVSNENRDAIKAAQAQGVEVVIATGRSYQEAVYVLEDAGIDCPVICANGAEIRALDGTVLHTNSLPVEVTKNVMDVFNEYQAYFKLYTNKGTYTVDYDKALTIIMDIFMSGTAEEDYEVSLKAAKERFESGLVHLIDSFETLLNDETITINKFIMFSYEHDLLVRVKKALEKVEGIAVSSSGKENIEVNSIKAQKGIALTGFVEKRNISMEDTMAIGDNYNDLSMFIRVGHSVAMGNAPEEIKQQCKNVTDTNVNHGVSKAILAALEK